jgi:hypothetical protein
MHTSQMERGREAYHISISSTTILPLHSTIALNSHPYCIVQCILAHDGATEMIHNNHLPVWDTRTIYHVNRLALACHPAD